MNNCQISKVQPHGVVSISEAVVQRCSVEKVL